MSVNLSPVAGAAAQFLDNSGNVLTGGKLYTYAAGTTTPQATYTSSAGVTFHSNPIILDAAGRVPAGGEIWLTDGLQYKFVLKDSNDVLIATWDNLIGINSNFLNYYTQEEIQTATAGQTVFTLSTVTYTPGTNSLSVFVDGVNQYDGISYAYVETDSTTVTFTAGLHVGALVKFTTAVTLSSGVTNASLVVYDPPFTGAVATNVENKLAETISVKDFGAVGDGVIDDTTAIQNAVNALTTSGGRVYFPAGKYKISSTLALNSNYGATLSGSNGTAIWNGLAFVYEAGSVLVKDASMTTEAIQNNGSLGLTIENLAITGEAGNTGDGIYLLNGQSTRLYNVAVAKVGGVGIRIGAKSGASGNVNGWQLIGVTSQYNGSHGVLIYDETLLGGPNANAGTATGLNLAGNSGDGLKIENGQFNTFNGLLSQQNTGYGVSLIGTVPLSLYTTFNGGDIEANTAGNWNVGANAKHLVFSGAFPNIPTFDPSTNFATLITGSSNRFRSVDIKSGTAILSSLNLGQASNLTYYNTSQFTPTVIGLSTAGVNTYVWQSGYYTRVGNLVTIEGVVRLSAKGAGGNAMVGDLAIANLPFTSLNSTLARSPVTLSPNGGISTGAGFSTQINGSVFENQNYIRLFKISTTDGSATAMVATDITDTFICYFSGSYLVQ